MFVSIISRKALTTFLLISIYMMSLGQQLPEIKTKAPIHNFNRGLGFMTPDSLYSVNIRFRIQARALMNTVSDKDLNPQSWETRIRRARLSFTGHVYNPRLSYYLQLSFSRGDMDWSVGDVSTQNTSANVLRDAVIFYNVTPSLQLALGQTKLPGNRQRTNSSGALQFYDRSPLNANFTLDRDFGLFANYKINLGTFKTLLRGAISSGEGRNSTLSNSGLAYTGRAEFLPFGYFSNEGDYFEGDVFREPKPKLSIACGYHFNDLAVRTQGQLGKDLYSPKSYNVYFADILFKYKGFAIASEFMKRDTEGSPITTNALGDIRYIITGGGLNTQVSYCFKTRWEVATRYTFITPNKSIHSLFNQNRQYGVGVTRYLMEHKVKLQFNTFYNHDRNLSTSTDELRNFFGVFQIELGI